jgi:hypothetical protein
MICVNDDSNDDDGGDGKGDGDGDGNGNGDCDGDGNADDATAVDGKDVDEDNGSDSRMAIGHQRWDNVDVGRQ